MSRHRFGALVALLIVCVVACAVSASRAARAARAKGEAQESLSRLGIQRSELDALRAASPGPIGLPSARADLSPAITLALQAAGSGPEALGSLTQRSDRSLDPAVDREREAGGRTDRETRERVVSVSLRGMELSAFGAFMAAWRSNEPQWILAAIELAPSPEDDGTVSIVLELRRVYVVGAVSGAGDS
jgi:hypothetical protein